MGARGYGISLRVFNYVAHEWDFELNTRRKISYPQATMHVLFCLSYKLDKTFTDKKSQLYSSMIFDILKDQKGAESYRVVLTLLKMCWKLLISSVKQNT